MTLGSVRVLGGGTAAGHRSGPQTSAPHVSAGWVAAAVRIGDQILAQRIGSAAAPTWLAPSGYGTDLDPLLLKPVDSNFYNGKIGIALFFAALARITGQGAYREACLQAIHPARRKLELSLAGQHQLPNLPVGALLGISSFIYGFLHIGRLLDDDHLIAQALRLTALVTPQRIAADHRVWVQVGSAGALLVMLACEPFGATATVPASAPPGPAPLEIATLCAEQILAQRTAFEGRPRAWLLSPGHPPLIGFSYGAAGVCHALLRLYGQTGDPRLLAAAHEGWEFVRGLYSPALATWLDIRTLFQQRFAGPEHGDWRDWWKSGGQLAAAGPADRPPREVPPSPRFTGAWCHGATGVLLARLGSLDVLHDAEADQDIRRCLPLVLACGEGSAFADDPRDDLCCGHAGRIMALQVAAQRLGDPALLVAAHELAARMLARADHLGRFRFSSARGTDAWSPTLFQGAAGVGYSLLRLACPEELPCLLLVE